MANQLTFDLALPPPTYAREDFVVASGNREALAWIDRWPDWPAPALALGGPAGCGKTHLGRIWAARAGAISIDGTALEGKSVADLSDLAAASPGPICTCRNSRCAWKGCAAARAVAKTASSLSPPPASTSIFFIMVGLRLWQGEGLGSAAQRGTSNLAGLEPVCEIQRSSLAYSV